MELIDFDRGPIAGNFDVQWIHGSKSRRHLTDPPIQVHWYDPHSVIIRESKDVSFEAPFMYLLFGNQRALLLDTGATADPSRFPIRATVDGLLADWLAKNPREGYGLVVGHTHGHGDHTAGDPQFSGRPNTTVVPKDADSVREFFKLAGWPEGEGSFDLGGRAVTVVPSPGHDPRAVTIYDPWTGFLVTGDTVYPGRLYVFDFPSFVTTLARLASFVKDRPVTHVMGCHIEMTRTPGKDYPVTCTYQPDEPPLQMTAAQLNKVGDSAELVKDEPGAHYFDDFAIFNGPCRGALLKQVVRATWGNFLRRIRN